MTSLVKAFCKPTFPVSNVELCPFEDRRGRVTAWNLVAVGAALNEQIIVDTVTAEQGRNTALAHQDALINELVLH